MSPDISVENVNTAAHQLQKLISEHPDIDYRILWVTSSVADYDVLANSIGKPLVDDWSLDSFDYLADEIVWLDSGIHTHISGLDLTQSLGLIKLEFATSGKEAFTAYVVSWLPHHKQHIASKIVLAAVPIAYQNVFAAYNTKSYKWANSLSPANSMRVVGGHESHYVATSVWSDIILPDNLISDIQTDVYSFFSHGIQIYKKLNLNPFRKILFAGVPGTGKSMICSAIANWAQDNSI